MNSSNPTRAGAGIRYSFNYITFSCPIRSGGGGGRAGGGGGGG